MWGVEARATHQLGKSLGLIKNLHVAAQRDAHYRGERHYLASQPQKTKDVLLACTFTLVKAQMAFLISYKHNCMDCILSHTSRSPHCRWGAARFVVASSTPGETEKSTTGYARTGSGTSTCWQVFLWQSVNPVAVIGGAEFRGAGQARRGSEGGFSLADRRIDPSRRPPLNHARS